MCNKPNFDATIPRANAAIDEDVFNKETNEGEQTPKRDSASNKS
jgi:hypothetical protein